MTDTPKPPHNEQSTIDIQESFSPKSTLKKFSAEQYELAIQEAIEKLTGVNKVSVSVKNLRFIRGDFFSRSDLMRIDEVAISIHPEPLPDDLPF